VPSRLGLVKRLREIRADVRSARIHSEAAFAVASDSALVAAEAMRALAVCQQQLVDIRADLIKLSTSAADSSAAVSVAHAQLLGQVAALGSSLAAASATATADHERTLLGLRMVRDDDAAARAALWAVRETAEYEAAFEEDEPLVTILITTYLNWPLLRDRALPSVLGQTYERLEVIVVGDAAPDDARQVVESFGDPRLRFINLPYRGPYPEDPRDAWQISGTTPWNTGYALAKGHWIGSTSDDDALRPSYVESLLKLARRERAEVPYGSIQALAPDGPAERLGAFPPYSGQWNMQSSLLHRGLRFLPLQPSDWVFDVPNDVSLLERMLRIGVRFAMIDEPVVDIYPSRLWSGREEGRLARREQF
jgi:hypothetical protein